MGERDMKYKMTKLILIYGLLIVLNACVTRGASHGDINGKWKLTGYNFATKQEFAIETMTVFVSISDNKQIGGNSGCNIFGGDLTVMPGHKIKVGTLISTDRFCDEITGSFESLFTDTLQNSTEYTLEGKVLTFSNLKSKSWLRFERDRDETHVSPPATEERMTFFIRDRLTNCETNPSEKCLQFKTEKTSAWHVLAERIDGFDFKPGRFYKIEVIRVKAKNEPNNPSFYRYKIGRIIRSVRNEKDLYK